MALIFENGNYILTYKGHLENKAGIKSIGVWWYLSYKIYGKQVDILISKYQVLKILYLKHRVYKTS